MWLDILFVVAGAVLILTGADRLTDGAASIARRFGIPELVIGLTIVAIGTSLPEFVVSFVASLKGAASMSIGNIVGSNIFNTMLIVGATAMVAPIAVSRSTVNKDIPFMLLASLVVSALALDHLVSGGTADVLTRGDGIALLGFMAVFITYTLAIARSGGEEQPSSSDGQSAAASIPVWKSVLFILYGLFGLIVGGELFVNGATGIARLAGLSDAVIGLTLVAGGTSLPELATSIIAARKGKSDIAIGNVIGSNMFNVFGILGVCSCISPLPAEGLTWVDFGMLLFGAVLFWFFSRTQHRIIRWEGAIMVLCFLGYMTWLLNR